MNLTKSFGRRSMVNKAKDKGWRHCPINESNYIDGVLQEAKEDTPTCNTLVMNSIKRIRKEEEKR